MHMFIWKSCISWIKENLIEQNEAETINCEANITNQAFS